MLINSAMLIRGRIMLGGKPSSARDDERRSLDLVSSIFKQSGWKVTEVPSRSADLLVQKGRSIYVIEIKRSAEARKDRALPLLSQAILQAQTAAHSAKPSASALAVFVAPRVPDALAAELQDFAMQHVPEVAVGVVDDEGFRSFRGAGLEDLNAQRSPGTGSILPRQVGSPQLFSDLNQWMLKVLLAPAILDSYLCAPRRDYKNASQLAEAANVTVMSAFRFVRSFKEEGLLEESSGVLKIVRIRELLRRWQASTLHPAREIPARWLLGGGSKKLESALRSYQSEAKPTSARSRKPVAHVPKVCLGLFAAADALGTGFVQGVPPTIYMEKADANAIGKLGLSPEVSGESPDVFIRIPRSPKAVFRSSVERDGVPVSDVLQVWLDVSNHPARGKQQAEQLERGVLSKLFAGDY